MEAITDLARELEQELTDANVDIESPVTDTATEDAPVVKLPAIGV